MGSSCAHFTGQGKLLLQLVSVHSKRWLCPEYQTDLAKAESESLTERRSDVFKNLLNPNTVRICDGGLGIDRLRLEDV